MNRVKKLLKSKGIKLIFMDLDNEGYYESEYKTMFVNENLSDFEILKVIYHELGHGVLHDDFSALYKMTVPHFKMEYEADYFMLKLLLLEYMEVNILDPEQVNPVYFIESNDLDPRYEEAIKKILYNNISNTLYV